MQTSFVKQRGYMYCPACGTETSKNQKFCRSCGMGLQMISETVAEHPATAESAETHDGIIETTYCRQKKLERWGVIIGLSGFVMLLLMVAGPLVSRPFSKAFGFSHEVFGFISPLVLAIAFPLLIGGLGLALYPRLVKELSKPNKVARNKS